MRPPLPVCVCAQEGWDFEWRCRHCFRQYSAWQMCSCRKHRQPWWTTTSECHKPGCTFELQFCQILHARDCEIFPESGVWLCCGGRVRDGKGCIRSRVPYSWRPEFADVRLVDTFACPHPPSAKCECEARENWRTIERLAASYAVRAPLQAPLQARCVESRSERKRDLMNCNPPCERPLESDDHLPRCIWR
jgi:hypothetical protein